MTCMTVIFSSSLGVSEAASEGRPVVRPHGGDGGGGQPQVQS